MPDTYTIDDLTERPGAVPAAGDTLEVGGPSGSGRIPVSSLFLKSQAATRALSAYGQSDGATSSRGIVYSNATRQALASLPTVQIAFEMLVPTSNPASSSVRYLMFSCSGTASGGSGLESGSVANGTTFYISEAGAFVVRANGATTSDSRVFTGAGLRTTYSGQRIRGLITLTTGTTNPVVEINGVDVSASFTATTAGTPPNWLDASLSSAFQIAGFNWPAGEIPAVTPILGSLSTAEETEYWATARLPAWVMAGGSAVNRILDLGRNSTFASGATDWVAAGSGSPSIAIVSGALAITGSGGIGGAALGTAYTGSLQIGARYLWEFDVVSSTGGTWTLAIGGSNEVVLSPIPSSGRVVVERTISSATTATQPFRITLLSGTETLTIDNVVLRQIGALTAPGWQATGTVRDLTTLESTQPNQGRIVGVRPVLLTPQAGSKIAVRSQSFIGGVSVQIFGGSVIGAIPQRITSITGNSSASTTVSIGTESDGTQIVSSHAVSGNFDITTFVSRLLAANASIWLTFAGDSTASLTINTQDR